MSPLFNTIFGLWVRCEFYLDIQSFTSGKAIFTTAVEEPELEFEKKAAIYSHDHFGDIACTRGTKRKARIQCADDWHFIVVKKDDYNKFIDKFNILKRQEKIGILKNIPFISHWSKAMLSKLSDQLK